MVAAILADEMGLGKTVQVLNCLLLPMFFVFLPH
jgi:SNF2 family DNA or RNA helicase